MKKQCRKCGKEQAEPSEIPYYSASCFQCIYTAYLTKFKYYVTIGWSRGQLLNWIDSDACLASVMDVTREKLIELIDEALMARS